MSFADKYLFQRLNTDDADNVLAKGTFRKLVNGRATGVTADKNRFLIENFKGNVQLNYTLPVGSVNKVIGSKYIKQIDTIFFFLYNSSGNHGIYQIYNDIISKVFEWSGLNFTENNIITQIDYADGDLYWTDNTEEPRFINVAKGLAGLYVSPIESDITVIRRPPMYPLGASRQTDAGRSANNIADHAFQFSYRYVYDGNKYSVLATYSKMVNYAIPADASKNYLTITIPPEEVKPFGVKKIQLLYREGSSGLWYIWKDVKDDTLSHDFYNDTQGILEPNIDERTLFHDVPIKAAAQAFIKNRIFYGNYVKGFDLPESVDFTASAVLRAVTSEQTWRISEFIQIHQTTGVSTVLGYWGKNPNDNLYYEVSYNSGTDTVTQVGFTGMTYAEVEASYSPDNATYWYQMPVLGWYTFDVTTDTNDPYMKAGGEYQLSILFTGPAGRNVGSITNDGAKVYLDQTPESTDKYLIGWDLSAVTSDQIPEWATNYYILRTENLRASFFMQGETSDAWYRGAGDNYWKTNHNSDYLFFDVIDFIKNNTGYTHSEGDRIKIWDVNGTDYDLEIDHMEGQFVAIKLFDIGTFPDSANYSFEIYRPRLTNQEQLFYEVGNGYVILNPGTASRDLSVKSGSVNGDTYDVDRMHYKYNLTGYDNTDPLTNALLAGVSTTYEAMSPVDEHYSEWLTDAGRVSLVIENPQEKRSTCGICYSGELLPDSNWNELNVFTSLNRYDKIGEEYTPIKAFTVIKDHLIAHHEKNTSAYLLGEGVTHNVNGQLLVKTDSVIGNHEMLQGGNGCIPETVKIDKKMDRAWWLDPYGHLVRYTAAGVQTISDGEYGIERKTKGYCETVRGLTTNLPRGGYDPDTNEYFIMFPNMETLVFSEDNQGWVGSPELWPDSTGIEPELFESNLNYMYSFLGGQVWKHYGNPLYNNFYGSQKTRELHFVMNTEPSKNKVWENIWIEADQLANSTTMRVVEITNTDGQHTYMLLSDFDLEEGDWKAAIPFDENTANMSAANALKSGDRMRSKYIDVIIRSDLSTVNALRLVTSIFGISQYTQ